MSSWLKRFRVSDMSTRHLLLGAALFLPVVLQAVTPIIYTTVDISAYANCRVQSNCYQWPAPAVEQAPEGSVTLGGVPFNLQTAGGNNGWSGAYMSTWGTLAINVNIANPIAVYTLINTGAGTNGPATNIAIEFKGSGGAYYAKRLVGGDDIRMNANYYGCCTNSINGTTTTNVVSFELGGSNHRLDMQAIILPLEFQSQSLTQITLLNWDAGIGQFAVLAGVTVASTSNPVAPPVATTVPVDFSLYANCRLQVDCFALIGDPAYPEGTITLGNVPFNVGPVGGTNAWWAQRAARDPNTRLTSLQIPVNIPNPVAVHTLINTSWGVPGLPAYASIEFYGSAGGYYKQDLLGNLNIRTNSTYTPVRNTCCIDNTSTINVYSDPPGWAPGGQNTRLDMQTFTLPPVFQNQNLAQIVLNDWGGLDWQAVTLAGVSVDVAIGKATPAINWANPADILFGTALGSTQLNATASVPGTFAYTPPAGTVLQVGNSQTLSATFIPTDGTNYTTASATVQINVKQTTPPASPAQIVVTKTLARNGGNQVVVSLNISNTGGADAQNLQLTVGKIGSTSGTPLSQSLGTVAKGTTVTTTLTFPGSVGTQGAAAVLTVGGTYTGGSFNSASRVTVP